MRTNERVRWVWAATKDDAVRLASTKGCCQCGGLGYATRELAIADESKHRLPGDTLWRVDDGEAVPDGEATTEKGKS